MTKIFPGKRTSMPQKKVFWSRNPGEYLDKDSGEILHDAPRFDGTVLMWYNGIRDYLDEICQDGRTNIVTSPEIQTLLEHLYFYTSAFTSVPTVEEKIKPFTDAGCTFEGNVLLSNQLSVMVFVNPYWPTNKISATESCDKLDEKHDIIIKEMGII